MPWLELKIISDRDTAPKYEERLSQSGALAVTLQDNADQPIFEPALGETPLWQDTCVTGLFEGDADTSNIETSLHLTADVQWRWHIVEDKDWEREWMKDYHPIQCGDQLWICPSWREPPDPSAVNIMLDPGLAFGTGTHPTTFLCLQWLSKQSVDQLSAVDYGCGSGILGIACLLLGAEKVIGVDIDPQALLATQDNATRNGFAADAFPVYFPSKAPTEQVDIVLANILAGPLTDLYESLTALTKPGGRICLSGVLATQASTVTECYSRHFTDMDITQKEEWVCITGTKRA